MFVLLEGSQELGRSGKHEQSGKLQRSEQNRVKSTKLWAQVLWMQPLWSYSSANHKQTQPFRHSVRKLWTRELEMQVWPIILHPMKLTTLDTKKYLFSFLVSLIIIWSMIKPFHNVQKLEPFVLVLRCPSLSLMSCISVAP